VYDDRVFEIKCSGTQYNVKTVTSGIAETHTLELNQIESHIKKCLRIKFSFGSRYEYQHQRTAALIGEGWPTPPHQHAASACTT